jgi:hypothetical protein
MILADALREPHRSQIYLERYVNGGSPSGFSSIHTASHSTCHLGENATFQINAVIPSTAYAVIEFGEQTSLLPPNYILLHPDVTDECPLLKEGTLLRNYAEVVPTSSDRTVQLVSAPHVYYKLSYPRLIGRINRHLAQPQAEAAVWVTKAIDAASGELCRRFRFLREGYARVATFEGAHAVDEWGFTVRDAMPSPKTGGVLLMIPGFSLFARDRHAPSDDFLLQQLFEMQHQSIDDFLFSKLVQPLIDCYFSLLIECGLQLEAHAQNILFGVDSRSQVTTVIARDAESVDRDVSLMDDLGLSISRPVGNYKILRRSDYNYQIMHSFMFDFKMGEYLITPLINLAKTLYPFDAGRLVGLIRDCSRGWIAKLPPDFFPEDGNWYGYENIIHDRTRDRPYTKHPNPAYR